MLASLRTVGLVALALISTSCNRTPTNKTQSQNSAVINTPGRYTLAPDGATLHITFDARHIVQYELRGTTGRLLLTDNAGSDYSRCFFYRSPDASIWAYSSDIGLSVWEKKSSTYVKTEVGPNAAWVDKIPKPVWDNMPDSLKRSLRGQRR